MNALDIFIYMYIFVIGIFFGSFFNVVGLRVPEGKSIVRPCSSCPSCGHKIRGYELIPVLGYILLGGKCKECKTKISPIYPLFELLTGLLFVFSYQRIGLDIGLIIPITFLSLLIVVTISDLKYFIVPDKILMYFGLIILVERLIIRTDPIYDSFLGGIVGFGIMLLVAIIGEKLYKKPALGGGDIKLYGIIGLVLGLKLTLFSIFASCFLGAIIGTLLLRLGLHERNKYLPFVPFIAIGCMITYFWGEDILSWYYSLFNL